MSSLRVNKIVNLNNDGPVEFSQGAELPAGQVINGQVIINSSGIVTSTSLSVGNMNLIGVVTATTFIGSGIGLTGVPGTPNGKGIAFTLIA
jgi:hypothetical protein